MTNIEDLPRKLAGIAREIKGLQPYVASNMSAKTLRPSTQPSGYAADQTLLIEPAYSHGDLIPHQPKLTALAEVAEESVDGLLKADQLLRIIV